MSKETNAEKKWLESFRYSMGNADTQLLFLLHALVKDGINVFEYLSKNNKRAVNFLTANTPSHNTDVGKNLIKISKAYQFEAKRYGIYKTYLSYSISNPDFETVTTLAGNKLFVYLCIFILSESKANRIFPKPFISKIERTKLPKFPDSNVKSVLKMKDSLKNLENGKATSLSDSLVEVLGNTSERDMLNFRNNTSHFVDISNRMKMQK